MKYTKGLAIFTLLASLSGSVAANQVFTMLYQAAPAPLPTELTPEQVQELDLWRKNADTLLRELVEDAPNLPVREWSERAALDFDRMTQTSAPRAHLLVRYIVRRTLTLDALIIRHQDEMSSSQYWNLRAGLYTDAVKMALGASVYDAEFRTLTQKEAIENLSLPFIPFGFDYADTVFALSAGTTHLILQYEIRIQVLRWLRVDLSRSVKASSVSHEIQVLTDELEAIRKTYRQRADQRLIRTNQDLVRLYERIRKSILGEAKPKAPQVVALDEEGKEMSEEEIKEKTPRVLLGSYGHAYVGLELAGYGRNQYQFVRPRADGGADTSNLTYFKATLLRLRASDASVAPGGMFRFGNLRFSFLNAGNWKDKYRVNGNAQVGHKSYSRHIDGAIDYTLAYTPMSRIACQAYVGGFAQGKIQTLNKDSDLDSEEGDLSPEEKSSPSPKKFFNGHANAGPEAGAICDLGIMAVAIGSRFGVGGDFGALGGNFKLSAEPQVKFVSDFFYASLSTRHPVRPLLTKNLAFRSSGGVFIPELFNFAGLLIGFDVEHEHRPQLELRNGVAIKRATTFMLGVGSGIGI